MLLKGIFGRRCIPLIPKGKLIGSRHFTQLNKHIQYPKIGSNRQTVTQMLSLRYNSNKNGGGLENEPDHKQTTPQPHVRVTKEQLLAKATNLFSRLQIRFKWLMKRSNRPFNTDDYSALFSWLVMGNALLFFLATTTFFSLVIYTANTVLAQEFVARKLGEFITKNSNLTVVFEHAIVPGWSDGKISFRKCFVSRRPKETKQFIKGSSAEAYATSLAGREGNGINDVNGENSDIILVDSEDTDDGNYTQYDLTIEEVNVSLSFNKWVNGSGIIKTMEIKGLRGVVDRTHVRWSEDDDATNYKNVYHPGDFEFEDFKMEDVLFKLKQPNAFRPFDVAIYNCELSRLRKHWLFYDLLNANIMSGSYDNSLFTIHKKQRLDDFGSSSSSPGLANANWQRVTRCRVDSLNVDHLNTGLEGPFGWITDGKVDMVGDVMVPRENKDLNVAELVSIIAESIRKEATRYRNPDVPASTHNSSSKDGSESTVTTSDVLKYFVLDLTIRLNNVKASVPFQTPELSYINYALIRPIVAYINSKNTFIEIHNRVVKNLEDFSGSWTVYDSLLMDDISTEVYDNFVDYVANEEARLVRMKKLGFWTLQVLLQVLVIGLGSLS
ncbi:mitochondrial distribution and morphology protein 31 [[Candida] anglica]|uniref:Mitochondrial distribution and morphology protein 31 n=1 Tax=[Candida] anglica TaxID=148631 RepID=A0ABP0EDE3_9ASCO